MSPLTNLNHLTLLMRQVGHLLSGELRSDAIALHKEWEREVRAIIGEEVYGEMLESRASELVTRINAWLSEQPGVVLDSHQRRCA